MVRNRYLLAYDSATRSVWNETMEAGVSFGYDPITAELFPNYDDLNISDFNTKSEMEEREKRLRGVIATYKEGVTEIMRRERALKDAIEITDYIRRGSLRPVHCDLLNRCLELDFVHLSGIRDGGNKALEKSRRDFNHLYFWLTFEKVGSGFQYRHCGARGFAIALLIQSVDLTELCEKETEFSRKNSVSITFDKH